MSGNFKISRHPTSPLRGAELLVLRRIMPPFIRKEPHPVYPVNLSRSVGPLADIKEKAHLRTVSGGPLLERPIFNRPYCVLRQPSNQRSGFPVIRRITATLLLLCMVLLIPASASSVRVCFIEDSVLLPGWDVARSTDSEKPKCCQDCDGEEDGSCCLDVKKFPAAPEPSSPILRVPVWFCLPAAEAGLPPRPVIAVETPFVPSAPIRGRDSPAERRALLEIWNL